MRLASGPAMPTQSVGDDPVLAQWVDAVKARLEAGQPIDLDDLYSRGPRTGRAAAPAVADHRDDGRTRTIPGPDPSRPLAPESASILDPGSLGDYRIGPEIGRGGMGVVYEAEQISLGRQVALKVLPFAAALDPKQLQRFKNEAHGGGPPASPQHRAGTTRSAASAACTTTPCSLSTASRWPR